jgi:hypothetical protein
MARSRAVQGWFLVTGFIAFGVLMDGVNKGLTAERVLGQVLASYIIVWSSAVIIVSAGAVSSEAGVLADSILSRGITRHAYILAKYLSRLVTVWTVYLVVLVPLTYFATVHLSGEPDVNSLVLAHAYVLMHMTFLTLLGVSFSIWFNRAFVSIALLWLICYSLGSVANALDVGFLAPMYLVQSVMTVLAGNAPPSPVWKTCVGLAVPSVLVCAAASLCFARRDV